MDLRARIDRQWRRARESGDVCPVATELHRVEDAGVRFLVRVLRGDDDKHRTTREQRDRGIDPFEPPYDDELFVGDLSETHVALLNKFPVIARHLLVVTRADEPQQSELTLADFTALARCTAAIGGVAFYNSGPDAGASQPHKHLQLVSTEVTTESLWDGSGGFACARATLADSGDPAALREAYRGLLAALALDPRVDPYNLLVTEEQMVAIPRTRHAWEGIATNAMGYAGSFLVRTEADRTRLRELGPLRLLREAGRPAVSR